MKTDIYQKVTDRIIANLEQGELTWLKPWSAGNMDGRKVKPLRHNGLAYSGINVLMLWGAALEGGYSSPYWMTFRQAKELGAHVRKGERSNPVVYAGSISRTEEQDDGSEEERTISFLKAYAVFNACQIEGPASKRETSFIVSSFGFKEAPNHSGPFGPGTHHRPSKGADGSGVGLNRRKEDSQGNAEPVRGGYRRGTAGSARP